MSPRSAYSSPLKKIPEFLESPKSPFLESPESPEKEKEKQKEKEKEPEPGGAGPGTGLTFTGGSLACSCAPHAGCFVAQA